MNSIEIRYFAVLREQAKMEIESVEIAPAFSAAPGVRTYRDLYEHLRAKHGFTLPSEMVQVAVNDEFCRMSDTLVGGAKVVFIPPVAGG